ENVRRVFKTLREHLPRGLADLDRDLANLVQGYLAGRGLSYRRIDQDGRVFFELAPDAVLPSEIGQGRRFATGDARGLTDAEPLILVPALFRIAIDDAGAGSGGPFSLPLPLNASPDLAALTDKTGCIRMVLVKYGGFEPVERLVAAAVIDGDVL